jgi:hypothetical protein
VSTLFTDNFNRSNGGVGSNWTDLATALNVISNQAGPSAAGDVSSLVNAVTPGTARWVQVTFATISGNYLGLTISLNGGTFDGYYFLIASGVAGIYRADSGVGTLLGSTFSQPSAGDVIKIEVRGNDISVYYDGALQATRSDATYTKNQSVGILANGTGMRLDDFSTGNLPTISGATPSGTLGTQTTATIGCTTDDNAGTLYVVVDTASLSGITAAQIKAGQNASSVAADAAGSGAVSTTTPSVGVTGLTASTAYNYAVLQDSNGESNILTGTFTTAAAAGAAPRRLLLMGVG